MNDLSRAPSVGPSSWTSRPTPSGWLRVVVPGLTSWSPAEVSDVAETSYTAFPDTDAIPERLIVRRVRQTPGSQLALFTTGGYHAFVTNRRDVGERGRPPRHAIAEQRISELKCAGLAHLPLKSIMANAAYLALTVCGPHPRTSSWPSRRTRSRERHRGPPCNGGCSPSPAGSCTADDADIYNYPLLGHGLMPSNKPSSAESGDPAPLLTPRPMPTTRTLGRPVDGKTGPPSPPPRGAPTRSITPTAATSRPRAVDPGPIVGCR
jgi:hypothetical protein